MANEITIRVETDGTVKVVEDLKEVEGGLNDLGSTATQATEGVSKEGRTLLDFGENAKKAGEQAGVMSQKNKGLVETIEDLAMTYPVHVGAIAGLGIAIVGLISLYRALEAEQHALRLSLIASNKGLQDEVTVMGGVQDTTYKLSREYYKLYLQKRDNAIQSAEATIPAMVIEIAEMRKQEAAIGGVIDRLKSLSVWWWVLNPFAKNNVQNDEAMRTIELQNKINKARDEEIALVKFLNDAKKNGPVSADDMPGVWDDKLARFKEMAEARTNSALVIADADRRSFELAKEKGMQLEEVYRREMVAYESMTQMKLSAAINEDEWGKIYLDRELGREILSLNHLREISKQKLDVIKTAAQARADYALATGSEDYGTAAKEVYDIETTALLNAAYTRGADLETINKMYKNRELAYDRQVMSMRLNVVSQAAGQFASAFQMMYQMGGAHARKWFMLWKTAAIAESIVNTYKGATGALAVPPPPLGMALAAAITAAGMANVARIASTDFGSSATGGASGTYGVSASSGTPEYKYFDYESSRYGSGYRPGENEDRGAGSQQQMNVTINAMDSKSFEKYVRDNPNAIKQTLKDIQGGYV